jgi:hypothetical protein
MDSPSFVGHTDAVENGEIYGWALDLANPVQPVTITVFIIRIFGAEQRLSAT